MNPKNPQEEIYISRINQVLDYIEFHASEPLTLEQLARISCFSPFHFHRIFKAMIGETLNQYIQRIRLEKAATQILAHPKKSITEIALDCGFSNSSVFARSFKEMYRISATTWRAQGETSTSKIRQMDRNPGQADSKIWKEYGPVSYYLTPETQTISWRIPMQGNNQIQIEVKTLPDYSVAYVRHIGPYKGNVQLFQSLFEKLAKWAAPRGLLKFPETLALCVYHDNPQITDESRLRTSVCITIPSDTPVDGEIGKMTISGGEFAVAHFEITSDEFEDAWNTVCGGWLPNSGYQPDDRLAYEICLNNPDEHPERKHRVDICVPVKPL